MAKKKILFLTTANLAMKPRLVKELRLLKEKYELHVISFYVGNWTDKVNREIAEQLGISNSVISAGKSHFFSWFAASVINKVSSKLYPFFPASLLISSFASNKRSILLLLKLLKGRKKFQSFDFVIGRNTATILPLIFCNRVLKTKISFDLEDYHPGEKVTWCNPNHERGRRELMLMRLIPKLSYFSYASPLMFKFFREETKKQSIPTVYLSNSFYASDFLDQYKSIVSDEMVRIIWFSIDISANRGLEVLISALKEFKGSVELSLYGTKINSFYDQYIKPNLDFITVLEPLEQSKLFFELSKFDVGLACEVKSVDLNKRLAISNKIFAYSQAGLFVLATDTPGQKELLKDHQSFGIITTEKNHDIEKAVSFIIENIHKIRSERRDRMVKAKELDWEKQGSKLQLLIKESLKSR